MSTKRYTKLVQAGDCVAQVDVRLVYTDEGWSPYLSLEDAYELDNVREALRQGDPEAASKLGRIYKLMRGGLETGNRLFVIGTMIFALLSLSRVWAPW